MAILLEPEHNTYRIERNPDGSVTLSKEEFEEMSTVVHDIYGILSDQPSCVADYFDDQSYYGGTVRKWIDMLCYDGYNPAEYEIEDEGYDDDDVG